MKTATLTTLAAAAIVATVGCKNDRAGTNPDNTSNPSTPSNPSDNSVTITGGTVSPPRDPIANASNAASVKRYAGEEKLAPKEEAIVADEVVLRDAPHGASLGTAKAGDKVTEVAKEEGYYLVLAPDPDHKSAKPIAAWIYEDAVIAPTAPPSGGPRASATDEAKRLGCGSAMVAVRTDHDFCARPCKGDPDCARGAASAAGTSRATCDGNARSLASNANNAQLKYCVEERSGSSNP